MKKKNLYLLLCILCFLLATPNYGLADSEDAIYLVKNINPDSITINCVDELGWSNTFQIIVDEIVIYEAMGDMAFLVFNHKAQELLNVLKLAKKLKRNVSIIYINKSRSSESWRYHIAIEEKTEEE